MRAPRQGVVEVTGSLGFIICIVLAAVSMSLAYDEYFVGKFGASAAFGGIGMVFFYMAWLVVI